MTADLSPPVLRLPAVATPMVPPRFVLARAVPWKEWEEANALAALGAVLVADDEISFRPLAAHGAIGAIIWLREAPVETPLAFIASASAPATHLIGALRAARDVLTGKERCVRTPYGPEHLMTLFVPTWEGQ